MYTSGQAIFKRLTANGISEPPRTAVVPRRSEFACELVAQECTGRTFLGEDVRGSTQQRCFCVSKNSPSANVHGCTFADKVSASPISKGLRRRAFFRTDWVNASDLRQKGFSTAPRMAVRQIRNVFRRKTKHAVQECTRRFILERGRRWFNCLNLGRVLPTVL